MPIPAPITGITLLKVGSTTTLSSATPAGVWSSTNTAIATVNASTGLVTAIAAGNVQIVYTVDSDATAAQLTVEPIRSLTNGINFNNVYNAVKNRVLWKSQGLISDSQRYFEDFHPICDTTVLDAMKPIGGTLSSYLDNLQRSVALEMINTVYSNAPVVDKAKLAFWRNDLTLPLQLVANSNQFVGLKIYIGKGDYGVKFNSVILFFTEAISFNLYLYNDFFLNPIMTIPVTCNAYEETIINLGETVILNNLVPEQYKGGRWYLGYWQADILEENPNVQAVYYPCGYNRFHPLTVLAFSANEQADPVTGERNFNRSNIGSNNLMYGLNLEISTFIDATNNIVQSAHLFDELFGLMMACKVIELCKFSYRSNGVQRIVDSLGGLDALNIALNGQPGNYFENKPKATGLIHRVQDALRTAKQGLQRVSTLEVGTA